MGNLLPFLKIIGNIIEEITSDIGIIIVTALIDSLDTDNIIELKNIQEKQ